MDDPRLAAWAFFLCPGFMALILWIAYLCGRPLDGYSTHLLKMQRRYGVSTIYSGLKPKSMEVETTIIRCRCGNPAAHRDQVCPKGVAERSVQQAYWHASAWMRFKNKIRQYFISQDQNPKGV